MTTTPTPPPPNPPAEDGGGMGKLSARDWADACELLSLLLNQHLTVDVVVHRVNAVLHDVQVRGAHTELLTAVVYASARLVPEMGTQAAVERFAYWSSVLGAQAEAEDESATDLGGDAA